jgi:hypothetical protein
MWKEAIIAPFTVLYSHLPGGTEENYKTTFDVLAEIPRYKTEALLFETTSLV